MHPFKPELDGTDLSGFKDQNGKPTGCYPNQLQAIDLSTHLRRRRTYPGLFPILNLDHIYYQGHVEVASVELPRTRKTLMASDHLPLVAELKVRW